MLQKIKTSYFYAYIRSLRDVRVVGLSVFLVIVLLVTWSGVKVIQTNYELERQIARLEQENSVQALKNTNLRLKNEYLNTEEYEELAARRYFGKAAPGEKILNVSKEVALAHTVDTAEESGATPKDDTSKPWYRRNWDAWMDFFLHRQS